MTLIYGSEQPLRLGIAGRGAAG